MEYSPYIRKLLPTSWAMTLPNRDMKKMERIAFYGVFTHKCGLARTTPGKVKLILEDIKSLEQSSAIAFTDGDDTITNHDVLTFNTLQVIKIYDIRLVDPIE